MTENIPEGARKKYEEAVRILTEDMAQRRALRGTDIVVENLLGAIEEHEEYFEAWRLLGEIYLGTEETLKGYLALKRASELKDGDVGVGTLLGEAALIMERTGLALEYLKVANTAEVVPLGAKKLMALAYSKAEQWEDALRAFGEALAEDPPDGDMRRACAEMLANLDYHSEAASVLADYLDPFRDFIDKQPVLKNSGWIMPTGAVLDRLSPGASEKAREKETVARAEDYRAWYVMGNIFLDGEKFEAAVACYKRALRVHPDYYDALHNMGIALEEMGRDDDALQMYEAAIDAVPENPEAYLSIAELLEETEPEEVDEIAVHYLMYYRLDPEADGFEDLEKDLRSRLEATPDIAQILLLAEVYLLRDEIDKADLVLQDIEASTGDEAAFKWIKGRTLQVHGKMVEAEEAYRSGLDTVLNGLVDPTMEEVDLEAKIRFDLASLLEELGKTDEAREILENATEQLDPDGLVLLSELQLGRDPSVAEGTLELALELDAEHPDALHSLATLMIDQGRIEEGIILLERTLKLDPEDEEVIQKLRELYPKLGAPELSP